ncbi:MAG: hypothetical protein GY870_11685 [archaeon]|nr:hypothetical protein [archaeon]
MKNTYLINAIIAVVVGLFMIIVAPILVQISLEAVINSLLIVVVTEPQKSSGIGLFSFFFPLWRAIGFVAGITLLVIAPSIYKGEEWVNPVELTAYAIPSVGGMFMFLPHISFVEGFPIPLIICFVGVAGFWSVFILRESDDKMQKLVNLLTYTFIGMLATHAFVIGIGAQRMLLTREALPLYGGLQWSILTLSGPVNWIAVLMLLGSIPLMATRKPLGWRLALIAAISIIVIDVPTQIVRTKTQDYLAGALLGVGLLIFLLIPAFKERLIGER